MKKFIFVLIILLTSTLSSCGFFKLDYTSFEENQLRSYFQAETISNNRYVLYYYDSTDETSSQSKQDILKFFKDFDALDFYFVDTSKIETEVSSFGGYTDEPIVYVVSDNRVYESYTGKEEINDFIVKYSNIVYEYDLFEAQHITTYEEALSIEKDLYIIYYYLPNCPFCMETKPSFLPWAFSKSAEDIYFMNGTTIENADQIPTELIGLNSGTPILLLMSNGKFANELYSGTDEVLGFINKISSGDIHLNLDYSDFKDDHIDFFETLDITSDLHFEYYYSPTCAHCNLVKGQLLSFFYNQKEVPYYFINITDADGTVRIADFSGTPSLYLVKDKKVVAKFIGSVEIPNFIDEYNQGKIDFTDY